MSTAAHVEPAIAATPTARRPPWAAVSLLADPPGWLAALLLSAAGASLAVWTWGKNFHLFVDYGRELYVPWRLAQGDVLYRDIAWFNGPLSAYANALVFWLFGTGIRTQALANLALIAIVTVMVWRVGGALANRSAALAASAAWLLASAFQNLDPSGNFNWVAPYSHEMTHGVALALLTLWLLRGALRSGAFLAFAWCGGALGLCLLTKAEVAVAALAAVAVGVGLGGESGGEVDARRRVRAAGAVALGALLPLGTAFGLLATAMPVEQALRGTLGSFAHVGNAALRALPYYRWCTGLGEPLLALQSIGVWALALAGTLAPGLLLALAIGGGLHARTARLCLAATLAAFVLAQGAVVQIGVPLTLLDRWVALGVFGALLLAASLRLRVPVTAQAAAAALVMSSLPWRALVYEQVFRPLGVCVLGVLVLLTVRWRRRRGSAWAVACAVLALTLLAKICLHVRISHYGFGLAMPAVLLVTVALWRVPGRIAQFGGRIEVAWATVLGFCAVLGLGLLVRYDRQLQTKAATFGAASDRFYVQDEPTTGVWGQVARWIVTQTPPSATLTVMPEGVMVNYLTRRVNPTRHVNFMPPEVLMFGEERMREDLERHPPDYIAIMHRPTTEYGLPLFGKDYGASLLGWVRAHYSVVESIGNEPLQQVERYGALILRRN